MTNEDPQLDYASPQPLPRPPMYSLVLCVLFGTFLIAFGVLLSGAVIAGLFARAFEVWSVVFVPIALVFVWAGSSRWCRRSTRCAAPRRGRGDGSGGRPC